MKPSSRKTFHTNAVSGCLVLLCSVAVFCFGNLTTKAYGSENYFGSPPAPQIPPGSRRVESTLAGVYTVEWLPGDMPQRAAESVPLLVTLHGSHGHAEAELRDWLPYA